MKGWVKTLYYLMSTKGNNLSMMDLDAHNKSFHPKKHVKSHAEREIYNKILIIYNTIKTREIDV